MARCRAGEVLGLILRWFTSSVFSGSSCHGTNYRALLQFCDAYAFDRLCITHPGVHNGCKLVLVNHSTAILAQCLEMHGMDRDQCLGMVGC